MRILPFARSRTADRAHGSAGATLRAMAATASVEVMPKTLAKVGDVAALFPAGTRVYVAHIDGTPIDDMVATAARLGRAGYRVMPHVPARSVPDGATLADWLARYRGEAGVTEALVLAGGIKAPRGPFHSSMQLLDTGLFDREGFTRLHVAGHPEGNRDIDQDGGERVVMEALAWKQAFAARSDAEMAVVTQFAFDAKPVIAWAERLEGAGIGLPVHVGLAGPAKLQTLIRYAIACGVGPSLSVLQRRAADVTKLVRPVSPAAVAGDLAAHVAAHPGGNIKGLHLFPLGGIEATAAWLAESRAASSALAARPARP